jgi:hypothetical protein
MAVDIIGATYDKRRQELDRWAEQSRRADLRGDADGGQP